MAFFVNCTCLLLHEVDCANFTVAPRVNLYRKEINNINTRDSTFDKMHGDRKEHPSRHPKKHAACLMEQIWTCKSTQKTQVV